MTEAAITEAKITFPGTTDEWPDMERVLRISWRSFFEQAQARLSGSAE